MTFTNAAAAEMRERVGAAVDKLLTVCPDDEHLWLQGALIPQAQITTIDSFCLNLIRNHSAAWRSIRLSASETRGSWL